MSEETKPTIDPGPGYRLLAPGELVEMGDEFCWGFDIKGWSSSTQWKHTDRSQSPDLVYRRKIPVPTTPSDPASLESLGLGSHPSQLLPYTRNKYTRDCPTLDGRVVPVDVYCVSEAFSLGSCLRSGGALDAVSHARKKLLAPGQRGQKTAIQDIKEAHASLARAIALEEAALGRGGAE